jgi:hypothetical protein
MCYYYLLVPASDRSWKIYGSSLNEDFMPSPSLSIKVYSSNKASVLFSSPYQKYFTLLYVHMHLLKVHMHEIL